MEGAKKKISNGEPRSCKEIPNRLIAISSVYAYVVAAAGSTVRVWPSMLGQDPHQQTEKHKLYILYPQMHSAATALVYAPEGKLPQRFDGGE